MWILFYTWCWFANSTHLLKPFSFPATLTCLSTRLLLDFGFLSLGFGTDCFHLLVSLVPSLTVTHSC